MKRLAFLLCLASASAFAQPIPRGEPPTPGVYNPTLGLVSDADASAVEKNPGLLGYLRSWSAVALGTWLDNQGLVGGQGLGFFAATPLPYLRSIIVGAGFQAMWPPDLFPYGNQEKLTLALAWRPFAPLAFGLSYAHLWSQRESVGGIDTLDLSVTMRARWLGAALLVRDVTSPSFNGFRLQPVWHPELVLRPFGTALLEVAAGALIGQRRGDVDPIFRLWLSPYRGLTVKAEVEWRRDVDLDGINENDVRVALGLQLDLERVGVAGFGLFGTDEGQVRGHGGTIAVRVSGERYPAFWAGPLHLEKVSLGPGLDDRRLAQLTQHLKKLERDHSIAGVVVVLGELDGGWATAEELRAALLRLRKARRHVFVYLAETTTRGYYVASAGERIYLDPAGGVRLTGLSSSVMYYKGLGDKLGVQAEFVKIAEYKSAPEAYTRTGSTEPARRQRNDYLDDIYGNLLDGIAAARHVTPDKVRAWVDGGPYAASEALKLGLVDELRAGDEVEPAISDLLGRRLSLDDPPTSPERSRAWLLPKIAVLFVDGDITDGKSYKVPILDLKFVGMQSLIPAIAEARSDARIKAIVVRVNSPGGSALASDLVARELERARAQKPVICSMGDLAASGGYFVSAPCSRIFAAPSTLTGSIGIFSGKFDVTGLAQKLGVSVELYDRGKHASIDSMYRPYTDEERNLLLEKMRYFYGRFVETVARGRGLSIVQVDSLGRGHIWSGRAAQARGLVDAFGGLDEAIAEAKRRAHMSPDEPVQIEELPDEPSLLSTVLGLFGIELKAQATGPLTEVLRLAPGLTELLRALPGSLLAAPSTPQARMDAAIHID
jgi:protease-4